MDALMASCPHEPNAPFAPITAMESAAKRECQKLLSLVPGELITFIGLYFYYRVNFHEYKMLNDKINEIPFVTCLLLLDTWVENRQGGAWWATVYNTQNF